MKAMPTLLILDDLPEMREWLKSLISIRFPAWNLKTAGSAVDFHIALERERPFLILMDEVLGPGEDLASLLKVVEREKLPLVLMTSMDLTQRHEKGVPQSVLRRIQKPDWATGRGTEAFLDTLGEVMALTSSVKIG